MSSNALFVKYYSHGVLSLHFRSSHVLEKANMSLSRPLRLFPRMAQIFILFL